MGRTRIPARLPRGVVEALCRATEYSTAVMSRWLREEYESPHVAAKIEMVTMLPAQDVRRMVRATAVTHRNKKTATLARRRSHREEP